MNNLMLFALNRTSTYPHFRKRNDLSQILKNKAYMQIPFFSEATFVTFPHNVIFPFNNEFPICLFLCLSVFFTIIWVFSIAFVFFFQENGSIYARLALICFTTMVQCCYTILEIHYIFMRLQERYAYN